MLMTFVRPLFILSTLASVAQAQNSSAQSADPMTQPLGTMQKFTFIKPLAIPFNKLSAKERSEIDNAQNSFDRLIEVIFVDGQVVKAKSAASILKKDDLLDGAYDAALKVDHPGPLVGARDWGNMNVNYCHALVFLGKAKNSNSYLVDSPKPIYVEQKEQSKLGVNWGDAVRTKYWLYVDLAPEEQPNPQTIRRQFDSIPEMTCLRHASDSKATRVEDFINTLGAVSLSLMP